MNLRSPSQKIQLRLLSELVAYPLLFSYKTPEDPYLNLIRKLEIYLLKTTAFYRKRSDSSRRNTNFFGNNKDYRLKS